MADWTIQDVLMIVPIVGLLFTSIFLAISLINERRGHQRELAERVSTAVGIAVNEKFVTLFSGIFQAREQLATYVKDAEVSAQMLEERSSHGTAMLNAAIARVDASILSLEQLMSEANALASRLLQYEEQVSEDAREVSETRDRVFAQVEDLSNAAQQFVLHTSLAESMFGDAGFSEEMISIALPIFDDSDSPVKPSTISRWHAGDNRITFCMMPGSMVPNGVDASAKFLRPILEHGPVETGLILVFDWEGDARQLREPLEEATRYFPADVAQGISIMRLEELKTYLQALEPNLELSRRQSN